MVRRPPTTKYVRSYRPARAGPLIAAAPFMRCDSTLPAPLLNAEEAARLALIASIISFPKGAWLYHEGDEADFVYNVIEGEVKTFCAFSSGRRRVTAFVFPGDLMGLAGNGRYISTAQAITPVTAYRFPLRSLDDLLRSDSQLEHRFLCKVCHDLRAAQSHAITLGRRDARGKIAMFLRELEVNHVAESNVARPTIFLPMTRSDVADYLGLSLEAVSRSFRKLEDSGIIRFDDRRDVRIVDRARFEKLAVAL
jgi:CRP-like cAMP-binding protein